MAHPNLEELHGLYLHLPMPPNLAAFTALRRLSLHGTFDSQVLHWFAAVQALRPRREQLWRTPGLQTEVCHELPMD